MIRLRKNNWWVRMAYRNSAPTRTDICRLFWRGVLALLIDVLMASIAGVLLSLLVAETIYDWSAVALGVLILAVIIVAVVCLFIALDWADEGGVKRAKHRLVGVLPEVPREAFKSWKEKHCALVRIED